MANIRGTFKKLERDSASYNTSINTQKGNKTPFREHFLGARKKMIVHDVLIATTSVNNNLILGKLTKRKFIAFLGRFQKQLYKRFRTIDLLYDIDIEFKGVSRGKNHELWDTMKVGRYFYNVDIKKAYWQIGNKLGYMDHALYSDYINNDLFKPALRYCFSFLARKNYMLYHDAKGKTIEIKCDTTVLNKVYENVRHQLYNEIAKVKEGCLNVVEWNIDGISVLSSELDLVCTKFKEQGLIFKVNECRKIDEYTYSSGEKIKNFKHKIKDGR